MEESDSLLSRRQELSKEKGSTTYLISEPQIWGLLPECIDLYTKFILLLWLKEGIDMKLRSVVVVRLYMPYKGLKEV